jgi:hypothetical protein
MFQTQLLKVVFTTLYADVKEPAPSQMPGTGGLLTEDFLRLLKLKTVVFASYVSASLFFRKSIAPPFYWGRWLAGRGGPDWTRTSDPALIKRML